MKKLCVILIFLAFPLFAREVEITIVDIELGIPLEGALIQSYDGKKYMCDEAGKSIVIVPDDRAVVIHAAYPGYESGRLAITVQEDSFTLGLFLLGVMEGRELIIEAQKPGSNETKTGRSVAISGRDIAQTAEIGIIEDLMSSIKLLPGVGYAGFFDAQPSIRGGFPGDMSASLDGFYILNPYHWGGGYSIFDPRMVQSAQLSHGVFSTRYGNTISGLLDIQAKKPSPFETEFEFGISTSAASFNISLPFAGKGGFLFMGRITYYDPVIWLAKQIAKKNDALQAVNSIRAAPYIRSGALTGNYRFSGSLELTASAFWGMDGVGADFKNGPTAEPELTSSSRTMLNWTNYQGFLTTTLFWNPRQDMLLKFSAGTGYEDAVIDGFMESKISEKYFSDYIKNSLFSSLLPGEKYEFYFKEIIVESDIMFNVQSRIDYDWELGKGFLFSAGIQEMYTRFLMKGEQLARREKRLKNFQDQDAILDGMGIDPNNNSLRDLLKEYLIISMEVPYDPNSGSNLFTTSGYGLTEYNSPDNRFAAELGMRIDHYFLLGKDFSLNAMPAFNPRLNADFNIFNNKWIIESMALSAGTGLFSTMDKTVFMAEKRHNIQGFKPGRAWTSVLGSRMEFLQGFIFNIEAYYKYIFNRMYIPVYIENDAIDIQPFFNGKGKVWGIDLMLQKLQSRFWDGWVSYSFNWAKYRDPNDIDSDMSLSGGGISGEWYFPGFHRFNNLNLILNIKPVPSFNIYIRFGYASGSQISKRSGNGPISYPVYDMPTGQFIEKYYWPVEYGKRIRTTPTLPLDIKFSVFGKNNKGKVRYEVYAAFENLLVLLYQSRGNSSFNAYTGKVDEGSNSANFEIPIPVPSFGFKLSY